jgi:hypothetical protein
MAKNIGRWRPLLIKKKDHLKNIEFVMECPRHLVPVQGHQRTVKLLLEASMLFPGTYADTAAILQGPEYTPPAEQPA